MITVCCLVVSEGSIVSMDVEKEKLVHSLKRAITAASKFEFPAKDLTLYLAKRRNQRRSLATFFP